MQTNVESKVEIGDVKDKLISAAGDGQADFLVCGSRHLGTIERCVLFTKGTNERE